MEAPLCGGVSRARTYIEAPQNKVTKRAHCLRMSKPSPSAPRPGKSKAAPAPKPFNAREQLAMAKALRWKKKAPVEESNPDPETDSTDEE